MSLVVAKNMTKSFEHLGRTLEVLKGIDLSIDSGEMAGIVGASGAGKSTFLHCLGTLDVPTSGSLQLDGTDAPACRRTNWLHCATDSSASCFSFTTSCRTSRQSRT